MRLLSYENDGVEWGVVITDRDSGIEYALDPAKVRTFLDGYCSDRTVGYFLNRPRFFEGEIPRDMTAFLETGEAGMAAARRMKDFVELFIRQSDRTILEVAAKKLDEVKFLPPIPVPRLLWGLVGNGPSFARGKPHMKQLQLVPQGHQRPPSTVFGHRRRTPAVSGGNAELGVVIGKGGRRIPMEEAMTHVAGFTVVNDMCHGLYANRIQEMIGSGLSGEEYAAKVRSTGNPVPDGDIFATLSVSWSGKYSDRMCCVGPWITTPDEVGDVYDLLSWTRRNGELLGRGHTGALLVGVERAIAYYSNFATLYPGDIIHFGTVAKDGYSFAATPDARESSMESEFEHIGNLVARVKLNTPEEEFAMPPRELASPQKTLHIVYGNSPKSGLEPLPFPRFFATPGSACGSKETPPVLFSSDLAVSAELCAVIGKRCRGLRPEEVAAHLAGVAPMLVVENLSLRIPPEGATFAFGREWALPEIYQRWGDGANIVGGFLASSRVRMTLDAGGESVCYDTADYTLGVPEVVSYISSCITLQEGDVIALGRLGGRLPLAGKGRVTVTLKAAGETIIQTIDPETVV